MKVAIVGGGLGGLSSAITLAKNGSDVSVFEQNTHFGGKMMAVNESGYHFDFGPNTITMPEVFRHVVQQGGLDPAEELPFEKITNHTRNEFKDGSVFDFSTDRSYMKEQLHHFDRKGYREYERFLLEIERLYDLSRKHFLHRTFSGWGDYFSPALAKSMAQVRPLQSMNHFFKQYFTNPNLIQALNRYSTYIGSDPYKAPATFSLIAHLEWNDGVYYVPGGNTKIADSFVKAAENVGVKLYSGTKVKEIRTEDKSVTGVETIEGEFFAADHVILNGDLLHALPELVDDKDRRFLSDRKLRSYDPSISAFVILAGLDTRIGRLKHHHLFFSSDYEREFKILKEGLYADDPTIYICTSSKSDPSVSPGGDNCFILVNAPPLADNAAIDKDAYKDRIYERLEEAGVPIRNHIRYEKVLDPADIQKRFGAYRGALYGPSSNNRMQAFMRPFNKSQDIEHLWFCGGSTHPGGGSPMVVLSGQNVANQILGKIVHIE
ncbi:phytoene desaturase family protein [Halobacillus litoralis]|uniref:4,4'-diaponeurosporene oxygenase n=1 Tax=Halobacillus litoralis TaxID=45668 RepID=A0A410M942_9BACI|nr:phytoene desaturase family protein [Halobacillus litoralis]QAS51222.1 phytoene desaturase [Halobacillus litoralis]